VSSDEYDDPEVEARWLVEQRSKVQRYLDSQSVRHCGVAYEAAWSVAPYVSVWTVQSLIQPGTVGWWAISGDLPTDYLSGHDANDARSALKAFATRWQEVAEYMLRGEQHPTITLGNAQGLRELGELLLRRAQIIDGWVADTRMW
jgi:hypothetical protein